MNGSTRVKGRAYPLAQANIDTDIIIPAEHLKTVSRTGLGRHAFAAIRAEPGNVFDDPAFAGAPILLAGPNFGCGSSREHAVWALIDLGVRVVIAPSFSDIFAGNAFKNGLVAIAVAPGELEQLLELAHEHPIAVDIVAMTVTTPLGDCFPIHLDPFRRECLLKGLDEIGLTLDREAAIATYEKSSKHRIGWEMPPPGIPAATANMRSKEVA